MKLVEAHRGSEQFHILGIGLPKHARREVRKAFPRSIFQPNTSDGPGETQRLCDLLGRVVIFFYLPPVAGRSLLRSSAIFHLDLVNVIGLHPECTDALYDVALEAELAGVLCDDVDAATYRRAALSVQRGELWFPRAYLSHRTRAAAFSNSTNELSERELEVLPLLAAGCTNQDIADRLFVSRDTVRWHLRSIYTKLGVSDREAALRLAANRSAATGGKSASIRQALNTPSLRKGGRKLFPLDLSNTTPITSGNGDVQGKPRQMPATCTKADQIDL